MRRISILGIVLGGIVAVAAIIIFGMGMGLYAAVKLDVAHQRAPEQAQEIVRQYLFVNPVMYYGAMAIAFACSVLGGWLSAFTAREAERLNGALSALVMGGFHWWKIAHHKDPHSMAVQAFYVFVLFAGAWLGGWLRAAQKARSRPTVMTRA
jgi:hypothetical protein